MSEPMPTPTPTPRGLRDLPAGTRRLTIETTRTSLASVATAQHPEGVNVEVRHGFVAAAESARRAEPPRSIDPLDSKAHRLADALITFALMPAQNWIVTGSPLTIEEALNGAAAALDEGAMALDERLRIGFDFDDRPKVPRGWLVLDNGLETEVVELRWRPGSPLLEFPDGDRLTIAGFNARMRLAEKLALLAGAHFADVPLLPDDEAHRT